MYQGSGFGSSQHIDRFDGNGDRLAQNRIWKKLFNPDYTEREAVETDRRVRGRKIFFSLLLIFFFHK